jgi:peptidoglycan/LPS O-acetylase OafA/YrhL
MSSRSQYIPTLDGWRALAILMVIAGHFIEWSGTALSPIARLLHWPSLASWMVGFGDKGVEVFFCLSGFLITTLLIEEWRTQGRISLKAFYVRRSCRILPASFAYLAVISMLALVGVIQVSGGDIFGCLAFVRNYYPAGEHWYTGHFWSLSLEEQYYMMWPGLLVLLGIRRARWVPICAIAAIVVWRGMHGELMDTPFKYRTDVRLDAIMLGALAALSIDQIRKWLKPSATLLLSAIFVGYVGCELTIGAMPSISRLGRECAVLAAMIVTVHNPAHLFSRILEAKVLRFVGRVSYSLYLWQQLFFEPYRRSWWEAPVRLLGPFVLAYLSYRFIERPLIKVGHSLSARLSSADSKLSLVSHAG